MTEEGQSRARERNLTIRAQVCDAHTLPFADASFDAVTLQFASRHLEIVRAFAEIHRVLKPGARFATTTCCAHLAYRRSAVSYLFATFGVVHSQAVRQFRPEHEGCRYFANAIRHFYTPRELSALLKDVGFVDTESRSFLTGIMSYHIARKPLN